jgi:hypothetical protein
MNPNFKYDVFQTTDAAVSQGQLEDRAQSNLDE